MIEFILGVFKVASPAWIGRVWQALAILKGIHGYLMKYRPRSEKHYIHSQNQ
jgi:hypothetical protein